jgi:mono/diheme cytochrome c family protein
MSGVLVLMLWSCAEKIEADQECSPFYYENFGVSFLTENCQGCHSKSTLDREGAPSDVDFDDEESILSHLEVMITEIEMEEMPPAGGLLEAERDAALEWLRCMEEQ